MRIMKYIKRICTSCLFIAGLIGLLVITSHIFLPKSNIPHSNADDASAHGILGEKRNTIDVLILGDSESYTAFIPLQIWKETGYTSYICGTSGQTLDYTNELLIQAFDNQTPKIVILETNAIYRKQSKKHVLATKLIEKFYVFRYHDCWKNFKWTDLTKPAEFTWTDANKGFRYNTDIKPSKKTNYMKKTKKNAPITEINRESVQQLKQFCDEKGAKFVLISTPSTVNWNYARHNEVSKLASELNCEYIDMNCMQKEIPINWRKDTRDKGDHLNYSGATKVTTFMAKYLTDTGLLKSHKDNAEYKSWNDALAQFTNIVSAKK